MNIGHLNQCKDTPDMIAVSFLKNPDLIINYTTNSNRHKRPHENIGAWRVTKKHCEFIKSDLSPNIHSKLIIQ